MRWACFLHILCLCFLRVYVCWFASCLNKESLIHLTRDSIWHLYTFTGILREGQVRSRLLPMCWKFHRRGLWIKVRVCLHCWRWDFWSNLESCLNFPSSGITGAVIFVILLVLLIWMICVRATRVKKPEKHGLGKTKNNQQQIMTLLTTYPFRTWSRECPRWKWSELLLRSSGPLCWEHCPQPPQHLCSLLWWWRRWMGHAQLLQRGMSLIQLFQITPLKCLKLYFSKNHLIISASGLHEARAGRSREGSQPWSKPGKLVRKQGGALRSAQEARLPAWTGQEGWVTFTFSKSYHSLCHNFTHPPFFRQEQCKWDHKWFWRCSSVKRGFTSEECGVPVVYVASCCLWPTVQRRHPSDYLPQT